MLYLYFFIVLSELDCFLYTAMDEPSNIQLSVQHRNTTGIIETHYVVDVYTRNGSLNCSGDLLTTYTCSGLYIGVEYNITLKHFECSSNTITYDKYIVIPQCE